MTGVIERRSLREFLFHGTDRNQTLFHGTDSRTSHVIRLAIALFPGLAISLVPRLPDFASFFLMPLITYSSRGICAPWNGPLPPALIWKKRRTPTYRV